MKIAERWFVWAGMVLLGGIALAGVAVAVYAAWLFHDLPDASELADYRPPTATRVDAGDGTLIEKVIQKLKLDDDPRYKEATDRAEALNEDIFDAVTFQKCNILVCRVFKSRHHAGHSTQRT